MKQQGFSTLILNKALKVFNFNYSLITYQLMVRNLRKIMLLDFDHGNSNDGEKKFFLFINILKTELIILQKHLCINMYVLYVWVLTKYLKPKKMKCINCLSYA